MKRLLGVCALASVCAAPSLAAPPPAQLVQQQFALAAQPAMKVLVRRDGWYRVTFDSLRKAGFAVPAGRASSLQLFADGAQVAIQVRRDAIEFYGQGLDTETADTRTYWLVTGTSRGMRAGVLKTQSPALAPRGWFRARVVVKPRENYVSSLTNGPATNFLGPSVRSGKLTSLKFTTPNVAPSAAGALRVSVQGLSLIPHSVKVSLNRRPLGRLLFKNDDVGTATYKTPAAVLKDAGNTVGLAATGGDLDFGFVESVQLSYPHSFVADADSLSFPVRAGRRVSVGGFSRPPRVFDITHPERPRELIPSVKKGDDEFTLGVRVPAGASRLLALTEAKFLSASLQRNTPSRLNAAGEAGELLVLSHRKFIPALKPLVDLRREQGLKVAVVDVDDVYDEFGFGAHGPQPIRDFLRWTSEHMQAPPRYVLLAGDATYDPRNFMRRGFFDFVPTVFVDTVYMEAPSDDSLADFNGDGVPEMAVGRLPVRTTAQAAAVVGKLVRYDQGGHTGRDVLLVADKNIDYDFEAESRTLYGLIPAGVTVSTVYRNEGPTDAAVRSRLLAALNQGPTIVNFFGHGATTIWTEASILKAADASKLTNSRSLSLYLMMTCLNGYFVDLESASLSEALVLAPNGGAIAVWSSTGLTVPTDQVRADQEAVRLLLSDPNTRLGDAMVSGKRVIRDIDVRHTWVLHGDPTTRLDSPAPG